MPPVAMLDEVSVSSYSLDDDKSVSSTPSENRRCVTFDERVTVLYSVESYAGLHREDIWYTRDDLEDIMDDNFDIIELVEDGDFVESDCDSFRGLEYMARRNKDCLTAVYAVMQEQERQEKRGIFDAEKIADTSSVMSKRDRDRAIWRARNDAEIIRRYESKNREQSSELLSPTEDDGDDTIQVHAIPLSKIKKTGFYSSPLKNVKRFLSSPKKQKRAGISELDKLYVPQALTQVSSDKTKRRSSLDLNTTNTTKTSHDSTSEKPQRRRSMESTNLQLLQAPYLSTPNKVQRRRSVDLNKPDILQAPSLSSPNKLLRRGSIESNKSNMAEGQSLSTPSKPQRRFSMDRNKPDNLQAPSLSTPSKPQRRFSMERNKPDIPQAPSLSTPSKPKRRFSMDRNKTDIPQASNPCTPSKPQRRFSMDRNKNKSMNTPCLSTPVKPQRTTSNDLLRSNIAQAACLASPVIKPRRSSKELIVSPAQSLISPSSQRQRTSSLDLKESIVVSPAQHSLSTPKQLQRHHSLEQNNHSPQQTPLCVSSSSPTPLQRRRSITRERIFTQL